MIRAVGLVGMRSSISLYLSLKSGDLFATPLTFTIRYFCTSCLIGALSIQPFLQNGNIIMRDPMFNCDFREECEGEYGGAILTLIPYSIIFSPSILLVHAHFSTYLTSNLLQNKMNVDTPAPSPGENYFIHAALVN